MSAENITKYEVTLGTVRSTNIGILRHTGRETSENCRSLIKILRNSHRINHFCTGRDANYTYESYVSYKNL
jgi:hypothetical protein